MRTTPFKYHLVLLKHGRWAALKWFDGEGNEAEEYKGGRELDDLAKLCVFSPGPDSVRWQAGTNVNVSCDIVSQKKLASSRASSPRPHPRSRFSTHIRSMTLLS